MHVSNSYYAYKPYLEVEYDCYGYRVLSGCKKLVSEHKVENILGLMLQNTMSSRFLFMSVKHAILMNERIWDA